MSEENRIGTYQFVAEPFHVDFNGRLTMGVLGNHLLNCAGFHANDRGFGITSCEDNPQIAEPIREVASIVFQLFFL